MGRTGIDARLARLEAERVKLERLAQLEQELTKLGAQWLKERDPSQWVPGQESELLTRLQQTIHEACSQGMSERAAVRASGASRGLVRRVMGKT